MSVRAILAGTLALAAIGFFADSAMAKTISIKGHSPSQVKAGCKGGAFWPTSAGGTYGCVNKDGSGIVCGGVKAEHKKTCDTFRVRGPDAGPLGGRLGGRLSPARR